MKKIRPFLIGAFILALSFLSSCDNLIPPSSSSSSSISSSSSHEHTWDSGAVTKQPTCTEDGEKTYNCTHSNCEEIKVAIILATGHKEVVDAAIEPTCTTTGLTEGSHCSVCNDVIVAQKFVPALGHDYNSLVTDPTCTEQGYTTHTCDRCNDSYVDSYIDATGYTEIDYVANFKLDVSSSRKRLEVTVHSFIDGDTVYFNANDSTFEKGIAKIHFLGVNTPESTGLVEPWGIAASNFTKETLKNAKSIIIESESSSWKTHGTTAWIWYKAEENGDYRLLNLELLQKGYSTANNISQYAYKDVLQGAFNQALRQELRVNGSTNDPNYDYDRPTPMTLRYIRENLSVGNSVVDKRVSFEALITHVEGTTIYVEDYDEETEQSYGMTIFLGMSPTTAVLQVAKVGNIVNFCGVVTYSETFGCQVSSITITDINPTYKYNSYLVSEGNEVNPTTINGSDLLDNGDLLASTYVSMKNLVVTDTYTTKAGASKGAITITCKTSDNKTITVRTSILTDENGEIVKEEVFEGKTIDVTGIVDYYNNAYQVAVHIYSNINIHQ